jgi:hypothetical protein
MPISYFMFSIQIGNILLFNKIIMLHSFSCIDLCPPNCLTLVVYLFVSVTQVQLGPNMTLKILGHLWNILWHVDHEFRIMLAMCKFTIFSCVCTMVKNIFTTLSHMYNCLMENVVKQSCFIYILGLGFCSDHLGHTHIHTYKTFMWLRNLTYLFEM